MRTERIMKRKASERINALRPWLMQKFGKKRVSPEKFKEALEKKSPFDNSKLGAQIWDMMTARLYYWLLAHKWIKRPLWEDIKSWWRRFWRLG